jgi:putative ABC transport system substrate-binding protein
VSAKLNRRAVTSLLGGVIAWPLAAKAQQAGGMRRIGALLSTADDRETAVRLRAFRQALEQLGWSEGRNVSIDTRYAPAGAMAEVLAKDLVAMQPDVVLAQGTPITTAFKRESRTVPIVFFFVNDPIGSGFITSLARPGGNLTGLALLEATVAGKWLAMLKEIAPSVTHAALVVNPKTSSFAHYLHEAEAMARSLAIALVPNPVENAADIELVIESIARDPNGGLVLPPDSTTNVNRDLIVALAAHHRVPAVYAFRDFVAAGGLMSYGVNFVDQFRQVAPYVDRILRGANPAELPVQMPTKYETVLNLTTAKALGLTVPPALLVAADEVIE